MKNLTSPGNLNLKHILYVLIFLMFQSNSQAQQHNASKEYIWPKDSLVVQKLKAWQDVKFGLLMHWGTYSEWGVVESWSICPEDEGWCQRKGPYAANWYDYVKAYENLQTTFNPVKFNPDKWAAAAKDAGMKYVVFTTKHHDGFCMFDTKQTDYKITDPKTPFSTNPKANVTKEILTAFRKQGFMTGTYFSKPDWHSNDYWWRYFPPKDRNVSYDPKRYPERWNAFKQYTYNQIEELMTGYGPVDILWLDGGWVRPRKTIDTKVDWQRNIPYDQDIDMPRIAAMARQHQPGLLVVDRTVSGEYENYVTPEQTIPDHTLPYPWESCITMGNSWSFVPNDHYKSAKQIIHMLTDVVSKGGNLLLNIGPGPDGEWDPVAYDRLKEVGNWMKVNGEGIYATVPNDVYGVDQWRFTKSKKGDRTYAFYLPKEEETTLPQQVLLPKVKANGKQKLYVLGYSKPLHYKTTAEGLIVTIPQTVIDQLKGQPAWTFKLQL